MTAFTHQELHTHVQIHQGRIGADVAASRHGKGPLLRTRRVVAKGLVRTGAWLLPEKPEMVGGTVLVLPRPPGDGPTRMAA